MKTKTTAKGMLATFVALLCLTAMMPLPAWAKSVSTITTTETISKTSTVYAGEVVVDGVTQVKYLYSGDVSVNSESITALTTALKGMTDGDYATLLEGREFDYSNPTEGFALCSDPGLVADMDAGWSNAQYVGTLYNPGKVVERASSSDLYDIDAGYKAAVDALDVQRKGEIDTPADAGNRVLSHYDSGTSTDVYYTIEDGQVIRHDDITVTYETEATTVIYTKVELVTPEAMPLTFEAVEAGTITVNLDEGWTPENIQYNLNNSEWTDVTWGEAISLAEGDIISFRGNNGTCYATDEMNYWAGFHFQPSNPCYVYGNMMSLIDKDGFATNTTLTEPYTFFHLFQRSDYEPNTAILNHPTKDIVLPATMLAPYCYDGLFADAPNISRAPELPATTLTDWCYSEMFSGTALTSAPQLPATTLAPSCYADMFMNCTSLTTVPDLPAATLVEGCYSSMFSGCTALNYVKCLATDISADYCTIGWLGGVAATGTFVKAADMTSWTVGPDEYDMVNGIPAGWTVEDYAGVAFDPYTTPLTFEAIEAGTVSIKNPNELTIEYSTDGGINWTSSSANPISIAVAANDVVQFRGNNAKYGDSSPEDATHFTATNDVYVYGNIMSLVDKADFATNISLTSASAFEYLFATPYTGDSFGLFDNNTTIKSHDSKELVLPVTSVPEEGYTYMFAGCQGLTRAPQLPATTLGVSCYHQMFANCTGLTRAPELPATTLSEACYSSMFDGCSNLNYVKCLATDISADYCTMGWLTGVAATGTFVKAADMTSWTVGPGEYDMVNGIPAGWTVTNMLILADNESNEAKIDAADGITADVVLSGCTLYKDGKWNTICLPFDLELSGSALDGATARTVTAASISGTTLNLTFGAAVTTLSAGTPYIIKWESGEDLTEADLVFNGVTISNASGNYDNGESGDERVRFVGTYQSTTFADTDNSILLMGSENTLYYPGNGAGLGAQRAYFKIGDDGAQAPALIRAFVLNFGDDEATGIISVQGSGFRVNDSDAWYTLDGRRLQGQPTQRGIYINNGKKVIIK